MSSRTAVAALISLVALLYVGVSARQGQKVPGLGSEIVTVTGAVDVRNKPLVSASQEGQWKVTVSNLPAVTTVTMAPPGFLKRGGRYQITWPGGEREAIEVSALGPGGWVWIASGDRRQRWINIDVARSVEETQ